MSMITATRPTVCPTWCASHDPDWEDGSRFHRSERTELPELNAALDMVQTDLEGITTTRVVNVAVNGELTAAQLRLLAAELTAAAERVEAA